MYTLYTEGSSSGINKLVVYNTIVRTIVFGSRYKEYSRYNEKL